MGCSQSTAKGASVQDVSILHRERSVDSSKGRKGDEAQCCNAAVLRPLVAHSTATCSEEGEAARLQSLQELGITLTPEPRFDKIANLMKQTFQVEVALVALIHEKEVFFKAVAGGFPSCASRPGSFCDWLLVPTVPTMLVVEDASQDARFKDSPIVSGPPFIRFYAGAPLVGTECGHRYGTLCLVDHKPRHFTSDQYAILANFAELVTRKLETGKVPQWQQQEQQQQQLAAAAAAKQGQQLGQGLCLGQCLGLGLRSLDCFNDGVLLCDCSQPHWPVLWTNQAWAEQAGVTIGPEVGPRGFWGLFEAEAKAEPGVGRGAAAAAEQRVRAAAAAQLPFSVVVRRRGSSGGGGAEAGRGSAQLSMAFKPVAGHLPLGAGVPEIAIPSAVDAPAGSTAQGQQQGQQADLPAAAAAAASPALFFAVIQRPESAQAATQGPAVPHGPQGNSAAGSPALAGLPSSSSSGGSEPANGSSLSPETSVPFGGGQMPLGGLPRISSTGTVLSLCNQDGAPLTWLDSRDSITAMTERPEFMHEVTLGPLLGKGAHGRCYRGRYRGSRVAVKVLECSMGADAQERAASAAILEAALSHSLKHPNIVDTLDWGTVSCEDHFSGKPHQQLWILQSFCDRGTLIDAIEQGRLKDSNGQPALQPILTTAREMAGALRYLHSRSVVHGDLNPSNVLLTSSAQDPRGWIAQVSDFGLSRAVAGGGYIRTDSLRTMTHMPPELIERGTLSPATDVYSFGVLIFEMWVGQRAWKGLRAAAILSNVIGGQGLQPPRDAPPELQELMGRCMLHDPAGRPTFEEIWEELEEQCAVLGQQAEAGAR